MSDYAVLSGTKLTDAQVHGLILSNADLRGINLQRSALNGADLHNSKLIGANLLQVSLQGADLTSSDLRQARLIEKVDDIVLSIDMTGAKYNNSTQWPKGFAPPEAGVNIVVTRISPDIYWREYWNKHLLFL